MTAAAVPLAFADRAPTSVATIALRAATRFGPSVALTAPGEPDITYAELGVGCETTHANLLATVAMYERGLELGPNLVMYLYLPLAHSLARIAQAVALQVGGTLGFWGGDARRIVDEIAEVRPTHLPSRKKDLIVTSSGKNISPATIESMLRESRWISQAILYGDRRPYLVALLTLDPDEAPLLAEELGVTPDPATMAGQPAVVEAIRADVDAVNRRLARVEQIKRFEILGRDLTQADGELTPTLKVKRAHVYETYADRIERLYEG